jgi:choline-sulfatase
MMMNRREFVKNTTCALAATPFLSAAAKTRSSVGRPNVVVILCDQLRSFALGCYGNPEVRTPNIDRLAQNGFRFEQAVSNTPVCVPARSNLLSGQYSRTCVGARQNEMSTLPEDSVFGRNNRDKFKDQTLAEAFKAFGYKTAQIGKWHVDTRPSKLGFDESLVTGNQIFTKGNFSKNEGRAYPVPGFTTDHEISKAGEFFHANRNSEKPFFLYYNIISPHMPILDVPYKYSHMYSPEEISLRENVWKNGVLARNETWFSIYMWQTTYNRKNQPVTAKIPPEFTLKNLAALYYGSVTWVDDTVGEIVASLKENGLEEDTLIVFVSDHGDMLGSHHLWNKERLYEEASRIPMIYSWPGRIKPGAGNRQVASLIDVMPTLLDLSGADIPSSVQGQSLKPVLTGQTDRLEKDYAIIETPFRSLGIRTPTHLYGVLVNREDTAIEDDRYVFYNLKEDPYQLHNLAKTDQERGVAEDLKEKLIHWFQETKRLTGVEYAAWYAQDSNPYAE